MALNRLHWALRSPEFMLNELNVTAGKDHGVSVKDLFPQLRQTDLRTPSEYYFHFSGLLAWQLSQTVTLPTRLVGIEGKSAYLTMWQPGSQRKGTLGHGPH